MSAADAPAVVDTVQYPLHSPDASAVATMEALMARSRWEIASQGYCHLPGFLKPEGVASLIDEASRLEDAGLGFRSHEDHNMFLEEPEEAEPSGLSSSSSSTSWCGSSWDPVLANILRRPSSGPEGLTAREKEFRSSKLVIAEDVMGADSQLLELYNWEPLRAFLQAAFGMPRLHLSADPLGGAYYNIYDEAFEDALGWHFDRAQLFMNVILQTTPGGGGDFQFVPDSRQAIDRLSTWEEVEAYIEGRAETPELLPGSLYLFNGKRSLHRVSPVTQGKRITAILTFVEEEGEHLNDYTLRKFFGRTEPRAHGRRGA